MNKTPWKIDNRKINIALVGCGRIAKNHFEAIQVHKDRLNLSAVCDTNSDILKQAMTSYAVEGYSDIDQMLKNCNADLFVLCTPSGLHPIQTIKTAQAGRHVLTEKPMATNWRDGLKMVRACADANVRLFVVKQNRLNATMQVLKQAIDQNRFGKIYLVNTNVFWSRPQEYYDQADWRGTKEWDGGAFMNQASHYMDLMHWLIGPVDSIQAMMSTLSRKIEVEDTGVLNLRWRNGALGSVNVTMLTYPKNFEGSITILGEKGTVRIGGLALNEIQHWEFYDQRPEDDQIKKSSYQTHSVYGYGHSLYYNNVINCLLGLDEAFVDGQEGLASLELLIASYRASSQNSTVHLPLEV